MSTPTSDRRRGRVLLTGTILTASAVLAACSRPDAQGATGAESASTTPSASVDCAVNGALDFSAACTAERAAVDGEPVLVLRHADGGFRRFDVLPGGALAAADGTLQATVLRDGDTLEVTIGSDRYRLDASLAGDAS